MATHFITAAEHRAITAPERFTVRDLTPTERCVQMLQIVHAQPDSTQAERKVKEGSLKEILANIDTLGDSPHLTALKDAARFPASIPDLVQRFPQVEYYDVLRNRGSLNAFTRMHQEGIHSAEVLESLVWLKQFKGYVAQLPEGLHSFIGTPYTNYNAMYLVKKDFPECGGFALHADLQGCINEMLGKNYRRQRGLLVDRKLLQINPQEFIRRGIVNDEYLDEGARPFKVELLDNYAAQNVGAYLSFSRTETSGKETRYNFVI